MSYQHLAIYIYILTKDETQSQVWWYMSVIPAFVRLRQENKEFETSLGYIGRCCL
jgi:hypothetical protein